MGSANISAGLLLNRQLRSGGWSYFDSQQSCVESTSLAVLALGPDGHHASRAGTEHLVQSQAHDGGWPACIGDPESAWVTALGLCALNTTNDLAVARERAFRWLMMERGREGHWFWRWKFRIADREVRFDPDKYGWPWSPGTASWVIPTAFSMVAIKQYTVCNRLAAAENRIRLGADMLLDRACVGGGWNSGNSIVYGVPLPPHVEATAIALLALQDEERTPVIRTSLAWLKQRSATIESGYRVYRSEIDEPAKKLKLWVRRKAGKLVCSGCGRGVSAIAEVYEREVRDLPCFEYRTTVTVELYRVRCPDCGVKAEKVALLPSKAPFSKRFEDAVGESCESAAARRVAKQFRVGSEHRPGRSSLRYLERWAAERRETRIAADGCR